MSVMRAYFDETERDGLFGVAGCMFTRSGATKFSHQWRTLFADYGGCHMKELVHRRGRFSAADDETRDSLIKSAVQILSETIQFAGLVSCYLKDVQEYDDGKHGMWPAYAHCAKVAMVGMMVKCDEHSPNRSIQYMFEAGHADQGKFGDVLTTVAKRPGLHKEWRYAGHGFYPKGDCPWLEAADFVAWESVKARAETIDSQVREFRKSFMTLFSTLMSDGRGFMTNLDRDALHGSFDFMRSNPDAYWSRIDP